MNHYCRHSGTPLDHVVIDLGHQPPSNAYLTADQLLKPEITYPLKVYVSTSSWLVQLPAHASASELFTDDYAYFSSTSSSWCQHAQSFVRKAIERLDLGPDSFVVELASNDGYLLQYMKNSGIPCLGIEPTKATADVARSKGIETVDEFFSDELAHQLVKADLIVANNVLAHVPNINDFVQGIATLLKPNGRVSIEFPHLLSLLSGNQFDTIYHEHYSYFSLRVLKRIVETVNLSIVDVEKLTTHGGSLRVWLAHKGATDPSLAVRQVLLDEDNLGLETISAYKGFQQRAESTKNALLQYLLGAKEQGRRVIGYGAAAKGNTLLNYAGIRNDLIPVILDRAPSKQGKFLPGSHIPIISPDSFNLDDADEILVLPWNLIDEIRAIYPNKHLVTAIPHLTHWR